MNSNVMSKDVKKYQELLKLGDEVDFVKINHPDAMVSPVYKIVQHKKPSLILKICLRSDDYSSETYFLNYFAKKIPVPHIISTVSPKKNRYGAVLMEYLPGNLLTSALITNELAFELGKSLALIHENKTKGFGYMNRDSDLTSNSLAYFTEKFEEGIEECKNHLPEKLIIQSCNYFKKSLPLLEKVDGPCIIHRDFRPGNILIKNNCLSGIIDWSSARAGFAEDDFCSIEHGEWADFNGCKNVFLKGYSSVRQVPRYQKIMPLLRLNRALAVIGFTVKQGTWNTIRAKPYHFNRKFLDTFDFLT